ncbi:hypothetical protein TYRP_018283 [Tyrophagus putrescentiae]|nr:hypothetical protein TYRP_018283 [Tyrophagus putrescentiae]
MHCLDGVSGQLHHLRKGMLRLLRLLGRLGRRRRRLRRHRRRVGRQILDLVALILERVVNVAHDKISTGARLPISAELLDDRGNESDGHQKATEEEEHVEAEKDVSHHFFAYLERNRLVGNGRPTGGKVVIISGDEGADDHRVSAGRVTGDEGRLAVKVNRNENEVHRREHRLVAGGLLQLLSGNVVRLSQQLDHLGRQCGGGDVLHWALHRTAEDVANAAYIGADGGDQLSQTGQCLKLGRDCLLWRLILRIFREANDVADVEVALDTFDWQQHWGELVGGGKGFQKGEVLCAGPGIHNCRQHRRFDKWEATVGEQILHQL